MNEATAFWKGDFGTEYAARSPGNVAANIALFSRILQRAPDVKTVIEFGAGTGSNLRAIRQLLPGSELHALEINDKALADLSRVAARVHRCPITEWVQDQSYDLSFTSGLLIHIPPADLDAAYTALYSASHRFIAVAEYYSPTPVEIPYRGHAGRLWKRDFAGDLMDRFDLEVVDYGFVWRRDPVFPRDDLTWTLLSRRGDR